MNSKYLLWVLSLSVILTACNPGRHEMPITTSSDEARELYRKARDLGENGRRFNVDTVLLKAIQLDSNFALGYQCLTRGVGMEKAKVLEKNVSEGEQILIRATEAFYSDDRSLCLKTIDSLVDLFPRDKHCLHQAGEYYYYLGSPEKAIIYLKKAIRIDRYYGPAYNLLGYQLMKLKRYEEGETALSTYLNLNPKDANAMDSYGELLLEMGRLEDAITQYSRLLFLDPAFLDPYVKIAWIYLWMGNFSKAREYCDKLYNSGVSALDRNKAIVMMASIKFTQGDLTGALEVFDEYIGYGTAEYDYNSHITFTFFKGWYAMEGERPDLAIEFFQECLALASNPDYEVNNRQSRMMNCNGGLSVAYGYLGLEQESKKYLTKAREIYNDLPYTSSNKNFLSIYEASFDILKGDYESAISKFQVNFDRRSSMSPYFLAKAYELAGNNGQAIENYRIETQSFEVWYAGIFYKKSMDKLGELEGKVKSGESRESG